MNLEQVASSPAGGPTCSLSSLLTFGCRSRAESLAHKLQNKLWSSLGSTADEDEALNGRVQDPCRHSWVAVESRVGLGSQGETVVTSIPLVVNRHTGTNQMLVATSLALAEEATTMESAKNVDLDAWINSLSSYRALVRDAEGDSARDSADSVTSESSSNSGQGGRVSDSDQYFDFGIETPELSASGDEDESTIIINHDDGLPSQPESGCIFGSPVPSSDEGDFTDDQRAFYDQYDAEDMADNEDLADNDKADATLVATDESSDSETSDEDDDSSGSSTECALSRTASPPLRGGGCQVLSPCESARCGPDSAQGEPEDRGRSARGSPLLSPILGASASDDGGQLPEQATQSHEATDRRSAISATSIESCTCVPSTSSTDMVVHLQNQIDQVVSNVRLSDSCSLSCCPPDNCSCNPLDAGESDKQCLIDVVDPACCFEPNAVEIVVDEQEVAVNDDGHVGHDLRDKGDAADRSADVSVHAPGGGDPDAPVLDNPDPVAIHEAKQALDIPGLNNSSENDDDASNSSKDDDDRATTKMCRVGRSTSLKTGKTPPGTPGRKKIVRFADALGLDLEAVRTFLDEIPNVPQSAFDDLSGVEDESQLAATKRAAYSFYQRRELPMSVPTAASYRTLIASFSQPYTMAGFIDRVKNQKVCLETASMVEEMTIRGVVRVLNVDFHKSVIVRFSMDEWQTSTDVSATYVPGSCDGLSDRFNFALLAHRLQPGQRLFFALCYRVSGQEFWDSNQGTNYVFQCISTSNCMTTTVALDSPTMDRFLPYM